MQHSLYSVEGESETAQLVRSRDWRATPLGPMEAWPQSLRTSLSICLACRFPILLWWGPEMVMLYNDEYIHVLGDKHPASMGGAGREVWSDVWPVVGPMLDSVVRTGQAVKAEDLLLMMNRHGYDEEAYFSFSYSPIVDETGGVGGIFTPVIETTDKVIGHRRIELLRRIGSLPRADSLHDACAASCALLAGAGHDVPFGMIYAVEPDGGAASLCASFGLEQGGYSAPPTIGAGDGHTWPVLEAARSGTMQIAADLGRRAAGLPRGPWGAGVEQAVVLPLALPGQAQASAVLVAGVSPHRALDPSYLSFYGLLADQLTGGISAAVSYEAERKRNEALAELDRAKTTFFSNVSHEFRTPLTLMLGPLEEACADPALPAQVRAHLQLAWRNGERLLKLVNALLDFSRIEAGRAVAAFEPVDLAAYTAELASLFRSAVERAGLALEVDCAPLPGPVYADRAMWEKIVLNLLSNAFKFTFEGRIAVRLRAHGGQALLTVSDSGVGIAAADLPRVFERFQRIEGTRSRSFEGSGIGLALVRDLVALHGGEAGIESTPGQGTTVSVAIPFGKAHLPPDQVSEHLRVAAPPQAQAWQAEAELWLGNGSPAPPAPVHAHAASLVYVVDDNRDMAEYVASLLAPHHAVRTFSEGGQLLAAARQERPEVIVSDVMMPAMNGYELLAALKAEPALATVPVLLLSARAGEEARISAVQAGTDFYLEKPFSGRELLAKVDALLSRARMREVEAATLQRMQAIFEQAPCAIAMLRGPAHVFELANQPYLELVGRRDLLHKPIREALPELQGQGVYELLDEVLRSGRPYVGRALRADVLRGSPPALQESYFDFVYQPTGGADGRPDGIAVVAFDVTDAVLARRAADQASGAKDEFMAMLGHELRNPLAPIMTALEVMKLRGIDKVQKEHGIILRQARHLVGLVNDLLDVARVSRGKVELHREPAELAAVVAAAVETASPLLEEHQHRLELDVPAQGLPLWVDFQRMSQVFANLLTNAAKYSDKGGRIRVSGRREGDEVVFEVADSGRGIAPDLLPRVFDMFYQDPQSLSRSRGGLGLGLTIVRSLTELHGGRASADSAGTGKGATFTVRLPAAGAQDPGAPPPDPAPGAARARAGLPSILVVDDNVDAAQMLKDLLESYGYAVDTAFDGPSALRKLGERARDLAILDIGLPGMDGYELAGRIRQGSGGGTMRLVALTGYGQDSDRVRALEAGFDLHVAKPVSDAALKEIIGTLAA